MLEGLATELEARCEAWSTALVDSVPLRVTDLGLLGEVGVLEVYSVFILIVVLLRQLKPLILFIALATTDPLTSDCVVLSLCSSVEL